AQTTIDEINDQRNAPGGLSEAQRAQLRESARQVALFTNQIERLVAQQAALVARAQDFDTSAQQFRTEADFRRVNNAQVSAEAAIPTIPDESSSRAILLAFALLGLVAGVAAAFAREYLDESVHDESELE